MHLGAYVKTETLTADNNYAMWGFAGTLIWGAVILLAGGIIHVIATIIFIRIQYGDVTSTEYENLMTDLQYNGTFFSISTFATFIVCSSMIFGVIKLKRNSNIKQTLGLNKVTLSTVRYWFIAIIAMIILSDSLTLLLGRPIVTEDMTSTYTSIESPWILWFTIIIAGPIFEELFIRGFIMSGFSRSFMKPIGALLVSSAIWAAMHIQYDLYGVSTIFVSGLLLGMARLKSDSVLLTIGMHSFMNLVATIETAIYVS